MSDFFGCNPLSLSVRPMCTTASCSTSTIIAMVMVTLMMVVLMVMMILTTTQPDQRALPGVSPHDCNEEDDDY